MACYCYAYHWPMLSQKGEFGKEAHVVLNDKGPYSEKSGIIQVNAGESLQLMVDSMGGQVFFRLNQVNAIGEVIRQLDYKAIGVRESTSGLKDSYQNTYHVQRGYYQLTLHKNPHPLGGELQGGWGLIKAV